MNDFTYFNEEWNPKVTKCYCNNPRPNNFTGNCVTCNKIIKPTTDKNDNKHTR